MVDPRPLLVMLWAGLLLLIGTAALVVEAQAPPHEPVLYADVPPDAHLLRLDKRALEEAYHAQLQKLFSVWLSSGAPRDAAAFQNGLRVARRGYGQAAAQIAERERKLP